MKLAALAAAYSLGVLGALFAYLAFFDKDIKGRDGLVCFVIAIGCMSIGTIIALLISIIENLEENKK
jgi:hypothetical protein